MKIAQAFDTLAGPDIDVEFVAYDGSKPESTGDLGGWGGAVTQKCRCAWGEWEFLTLPHPVEEGHFVDATVSYPGGAVGVVR